MTLEEVAALLHLLPGIRVPTLLSECGLRAPLPAQAELQVAPLLLVQLSGSLAGGSLLSADI